MALIYLSIAFLAGIFLGATFSPSFFFIWPWFIPAILLIILSRYRKQLFWGGLCLAVLLAGMLRFTATVPSFDQKNLSFYNGQKVVLVGVVLSNPEPAGQGIELKVSARQITVDGSGETQPVSGKTIVYLPRYPEYHYGDMLRLTGELETPSSQGPGFNIDDYYSNYLARQNIYTSLVYPETEFMDGGHGSALTGWLSSVRERLSRSLDSVLPDPQAGLAQGLLLGERSQLPSDLNEDFSHSGTTHILAISGSNISIVAGILLSLGIWLFGRKRSLYIVLALLGIWLYVMLSGMQPSAVRAAIMASLFLAALHLGRQRSLATALAFAAAMMVLVQPYVLWDVGFQLSFLSMTGLVFLWPYFQAFSRGLISRALGDGQLASFANLLADCVTVGLAAMLTTLPLIAYYFGIVSLVSLPATLLALPALPFIIVIAFISSVLGLFVSPLAAVFGWMAWFFLTYMIKVVEFFADVPQASMNIKVSAARVWGYYAVFVLFVVFSARWKLWRWIKEHFESSPVRPVMTAGKTWLVLPILSLAIVVWMAAWPTSSSTMEVSFMDVGQGDAILIETPSGRQILIDGGPNTDRLNQVLGQKLQFWDNSIDLVVLTHPHGDHLNGLMDVLDRYQVEQVLESDIVTDSSVYQEWNRLINKNDVRLSYALAGQQIDLGDGIRLEVLYPYQPPIELLKGEEIDNETVVLRLVWKDVSFLFMSDVGSGVERELVARGWEVDSTVLKVGHHCSATSTSQPFLDAVSPELAVVTVGVDNDYHLPNQEVINRLDTSLGRDKLFLTSERGTIDMRTDGQRLWVKTEK